MPKYSTGEAAKLLNVSVRTVQFYDGKGLVSPSELTEGGRRVYSDEDIRKLKAVCYLRSTGLSIAGIQRLLKDEHPDEAIGLLIGEQKKLLQEEIRTRQAQLKELNALSRETRVQKVSDIVGLSSIAFRRENSPALHRLYRTMLIAGLILEVVEWGFMYLWISTGAWLPYVLFLPVMALCILAVILYYQRNVRYICTRCHKTFRASFKEMLFARHTFSTRYLTCTECGHKGFAIEVSNTEDIEHAEDQSGDQAL